MVKALKFMLALLLSCLIRLSSCGTLQDVESIPTVIRTPGSELLGKSLSLDVTDAARSRRDYDHQQWEPVQRNRPSLGRRVYSDRLGDLMVAGSEVQNQGYQGVNGHSYGDQRKESDHFEKENSAASRGEVGFYGRAGKKGSTEHEASDGYREKERGSHDDRSQTGFYDDARGAKKIHDVGKAYQGAQNYAQSGQGVERQGSKGGHRKGHHKSGFTNSYHKDESGNKSDFFDDVTDEGDHFVVNTRDGYFTDQAGNKQQGNFQDGAFKNSAQGKKGRFNEERNYNDQDKQKGNYAQDRYVDDKLDYGQRRAGESYDRAAHGAQEQNDGNHYAKVGEGYGQRRDYVPLQPAVAVVHERNYYPVQQAVGIEEQYYPAPSPVYASPRRLQAAPREYYPPAPDYYQAKPATYDAPLAYAGARATGRGYAIYSDPKAVTSPGQYFVPSSSGEYSPSATY